MADPSAGLAASASDAPRTKPVRAYVLHTCCVRRYCIIDACVDAAGAAGTSRALALKQLVVHDAEGSAVKELRRTLRTGDLIEYDDRVEDAASRHPGSCAAEGGAGPLDTGDTQAPPAPAPAAAAESKKPHVQRVELPAPPRVVQYKALNSKAWEAMKVASGYYAFKGRDAKPKQPPQRRAQARDGGIDAADGEDDMAATPRTGRRQRAAQGKTHEISSDAKCFAAFLVDAFGGMLVRAHAGGAGTATDRQGRPPRDGFPDHTSVTTTPTGTQNTMEDPTAGECVGKTANTTATAVVVEEESPSSVPTTASDSDRRSRQTNGLRIVDVAGGKGELAYCLLVDHTPDVVANVTIVDPRAKAGMLSKPQRRVLNMMGRDAGGDMRRCRMDDLHVVRDYFEVDKVIPRSPRSELDATAAASPLAAAAAAASIIVGLHPDEATDPIVDYAVATRTPFAVVPCCVFGRKFPHRRVRGEGGGEGEGRPVHTRDDLIAYLLEKHPRIKARPIPDLAGANVAVYCDGFD